MCLLEFQPNTPKSSLQHPNHNAKLEVEKQWKILFIISFNFLNYPGQTLPGPAAILLLAGPARPWPGGSGAGRPAGRPVFVSLLTLTLDHLSCCKKVLLLCYNYTYHNVDILSLKSGPPVKGWDWIVRSFRFNSQLRPIYQKRKSNFKFFLEI